MNVRNRRGIDNLLLRRVRRHQSMTALFRAPGTDSGRARPAQAQPLIQKQEQESPVNVPMAEVSPSLPVTPAPSNTVTRQIVPPSEPRPLSPPPSTPVEKTPDPAWKRLQTIFRKHEEHNDPPAADTPDTEPGPTESIQRQAYKEKEVSQTTSTEEHVLPTRSQETAGPAARSVQRSFENVEPKPVPASFAVQRKAQPLSSTKPETTAAVHNTEFKPALPNKTVEVNDQVSIDHEPETPALPLESVWNVQRVEAQHPLFHEPIPHPILDSTNIDGNETSIETSPVHEQKTNPGPIQLQREAGSPIEAQTSDSLPTPEQKEESHEPVEILSPSRPRPPQTDLPPGNTSIQRQSLDGHTSKEVNDAPPVNTAIGPLPADLWWLLGQKPPAAAQPAIQRTIEHDQKQTPVEQSNISNLPTPSEYPAEPPSVSNTIQRQPISREALPSSPQDPASPAPAEEPKHAGPDLDDLARRVYAEVRRRLAAEWERRR